MSKSRSATSPIGDRLREARGKLGLSQKQLGVLAGIDEFSASPRINQYERGKHVPDYSTATRLAKVLEVPVPYLYTDDDDLAALIIAYARAGTKKRSEIKRYLLR